MAKKAENKKVENKQEVIIKIEGQDWTEAVDKAFEEKRKDVTVSGFRKGKVPRNIYEKNFANRRHRNFGQLCCYRVADFGTSCGLHCAQRHDGL